MSRVREIPYNYTSFSDREIALRLLGAGGLAAGQRAARRAPHRPLGAHALRGAGRDLGDPAQPLPRGRAPQPAQAPRAKRSAACAAGCGEIEARRAGNVKVARLLELTRDAVDRFEEEFAATRALRAKALRRLARVTRRDNILFDGFARVSHVTDATDWRVEMPFVVLTPGHRGGDPPHGAGADRPRPHHHSARRRHRLHRRRHPAHAPLGGDQHREARDPRRDRARSSCPAWRGRSPRCAPAPAW